MNETNTDESSREEARAVIETIAEVEKEEAAELDDETTTS